MDKEKTYDLAVIGAGPGGYVAAIRASQLGMSVALVEKSPALGGTCLNIGCIPSKALLASTEHLHFLLTDAADHGLHADNIRFDLTTMMNRKNSTVKRLTQGIAGLMRKHKIDVITGAASIAGSGKVTVSSQENGDREIKAAKVMIATGSVPTELPPVPFNGDTVVSSTGALAFSEVPKRLVIAGAGAIGLELGSVWARLGSEVTIVEFLPHIATGFDSDIQQALQKELEKLGISFHLSTKVTGLDHEPGHPRLHADAEGGEHKVFDADKVLVAIGRRPNTEGLFRHGFAVGMDKRGCIKVDEDFKTDVEGIYAIGDVIPGPMLAHKAEEDGVACVERMAGIPTHVDYSLVPGVVYTAPEAAGVGLTEQQARDSGSEISVGKFPYMANGRALAQGDTTGFVKIVSDASTGRILGAHILSPVASELLAEIVAVMEFHGTAEDLARTIHSHPTLSEATKEAALAADGRVLHM